MAQLICALSSRCFHCKQQMLLLAAAVAPLHGIGGVEYRECSDPEQ